MCPRRDIFLLLVALAQHAAAQTEAFSDRWTGTWPLAVDKSTFGAVLFPGVPGLTVVSQTLKIERTAQAIRLSGETIVNAAGRTIASQDDTRLPLNGSETQVGPATLAYRPSDATGFEIISTLTANTKQYREVSRFVFSSDGRTLTETKTQTEGDRSSTTVLVFERSP